MLKDCKVQTFHGQSKTKEYRAWTALKNRCSNVNCSQYRNYGGRGIKVCKRWRNSFQYFLKDMGPAPSSAHSMDRINNNGNYSPNNCKWSTSKEQTKNQRKSIIFKGENPTEASKRLGGGKWLVYLRIRNGWSKEKAFSIPVITNRRNKKYGNTRTNS